MTTPTDAELHEALALAAKYNAGIKDVCEREDVELDIKDDIRTVWPATAEALLEARAENERLRAALEQAPMPGNSPLTGEQLLTADLFAIYRAMVGQYADWWEKYRTPALTSAALGEDV